MASKKRMTRQEEVKTTETAVDLAVRFLLEHGYGVQAELLRVKGKFWIVRKVS